MKHFDKLTVQAPIYLEKKLYCFDTILPLFFYFNFMHEKRSYGHCRILHYHLKISSYEDIKEE